METLNNMRRYTIISSVTGILDFLLALWLLHAGFAPWLSLAISLVAAGIADYFALEWWGFPGRTGAFSPQRLAASGGVEFGTYLVRMFMLWVWKNYMNDIEPTEHVIGLAVAYLVGFFFGYFVRSKVIFRHAKLPDA